MHLCPPVWSRLATASKARAVRIAALSLSLVACQERAASPPETAAAAPEAPPVHVEVLSATELVPYAEGTAEIEALRDATLRAETAGRAVAVAFERGDRVEAGRLLVKLDVGRTAAAVEAAQTAVQQAEAQLAQAHRERETAERLTSQGSLSQQALDNARDLERIAAAALENARAQTRLTRRGLTEATLNAPFDGTLVERLVEVGEYVTPGTPIARLVDRRQLRARVLLDPARAIDIRPDAAVDVEVHARAGRRFKGAVLRVGDVVDPRTRKLPVEVAIEDPDGALRPGLVARFSVQTGPPREALVVDENAVFDRFREHYVYVVEDGVARRQKVELGEARDGRFEITQGLSASQQVVVAGIDRVVHGKPVTVVEQQARDDAEADGRAEAKADVETR